MTRLILCRHAAEGDATGIRGVAEALARVEVAAVYSSPLERAARTAEAIAAVHGLEAVEIGALREIDLGDVDGLGFDDFPADLQRGLLEAPTSVRFPGGESYADVRERIVRALAKIVDRHESQTVVVVSHAGAIRAALAAWLLMSADAVFRIDQRSGAVNVVDWLEGLPLVRLVNGTQFEIPDSPSGGTRRGATEVCTRGDG